MADDAIENVDQVSDDAPQVEAAVPDESSDIVAEDAPSVEEVIEPEAMVEDVPEAVETPQESTPDLSSLSIAELRERFPDTAKALENAGAQAREAQLRRESGSREATAQRAKAIREALLANPDAEVDLNFLDDNNLANATERVMRALAQGAVDQFNPGDEERSGYESAIANLSGDGLRQYAMQMVSLAADRVGSRRVYDQSIEDIPEDSALAKSVRAREAKRIEAELKAADLEGKEKREPAPTVAAGRVADPSGEDPLLVKLEKYGLSALTEDEQAEARSKLGLRPLR